MGLLLSYPCYVVLAPSGWPDCLRTKAGKALCLFTDADLAEEYCRAKSLAIREQLGQDVREFTVMAFRHPEALLAALDRDGKSLAERGVHFVAINPTSKRHRVRVLMAELIAQLKREL